MAVGPGRAAGATDWDLCVVTACNPWSERLSAAENDAATRRLRDLLVHEGRPFVAAVGYSADLSWIEPGFALDRADPAVAEGICRSFDQNAYFRLSTATLEVVDQHGGRRHRTSPSIRQVAAEDSVLLRHMRALMT